MVGCVKDEPYLADSSIGDIKARPKDAYSMVEDSTFVNNIMDHDVIDDGTVLHHDSWWRTDGRLNLD